MAALICCDQKRLPDRPDEKGTRGTKREKHAKQPPATWHGRNQRGGLFGDLSRLHREGTDLMLNQVGSVVIERAHRIGPIRDSKNPLPIVPKLLSFRDKQTILDAWRCKGGPPDAHKTKLKLTNQLPQETLHSTTLNYQLLDNAKASAGEGAELKYRMEGDKLTINNQQIKPPVGKLSASDILDVDTAARRCVNLLPKGVSRTVSERGSTFSTEVHRTTSIAEVRDIYNTSVGCPT